MRRALSLHTFSYWMTSYQSAELCLQWGNLKSKYIFNLLSQKNSNSCAVWAVKETGNLDKRLFLYWAVNVLISAVKRAFLAVCGS